VNTKKFVMPFKKEIWEYQGSFIVLPLIISGLGVFALLYSLFMVSQNDGIMGAISGDNQAAFNVQFEGGNVDLNADHSNMPIMAASQFALMILFGFVANIVSIYYLLGALYNDRKDRSVLFWKSMPVSELQNVLTKFATAMLVIPLISTIIAIGTGLVGQLILILWSSIADIKPLTSLASDFGIITATLNSLQLTLIGGLWIAPFMAWILFVSAASPRSPFFTAVLPPLVLMFAERLFFGSHHLTDLFISYIPDFEALKHTKSLNTNSALNALTTSFVSGPQLWIGIVISAALLFGATWFRNNRYEI